MYLIKIKIELNSKSSFGSIVFSTKNELRRYENWPLTLIVIYEIKLKKCLMLLIEKKNQ